MLNQSRSAQFSSELIRKSFITWPDADVAPALCAVIISYGGGSSASAVKLGDEAEKAANHGRGGGGERHLHFAKKELG
jgi:hypothetical protein